MHTPTTQTTLTNHLHSPQRTPSRPQAGYSSSATEDEPEEPLTPTGMSPRRGKLRPFVLSPKAPMFAPQLLHQQQQQPQPQEMMMQEEYQGVPIIRQPIRRSHSAARLARQSRRSRTRTRGSKSLSPTPTLLIPAPATSGTSATKAPSSNTQEAMKLRLELDIDVHVNIKAKIHGDVTLSLTMTLFISSTDLVFCVGLISFSYNT
ncbi:hypothetical protein DL96DRAFT_1821633 [Flagelloscypha sp. PMI_526]|nr:hypothetical protein DL96DRAFT_1821633 [Flagelloscypha sp. PMI_526]